MSIATTDQIADFITRIRNAVNVGKKWRRHNTIISIKL